MKLKLYTDLSLLPLGTPVDLLIPFVGIQNEEYSEGRLYAHTFDEYCRLASEYIELTDIENCDACLFPINYSPAWDDSKFETHIKQFVDKVESSGKKIFVYLGHDMYMAKVNIK
ncbi:MAG: hypothetical protein EOO61_16615, partial [Hymenobacter sp.]